MEVYLVRQRSIAVLPSRQWKPSPSTLFRITSYKAVHGCKQIPDRRLYAPEMEIRGSEEHRIPRFEEKAK